MATNKPAKSANAKKSLKKELAGKIESVLPEMKTRLGDKKFHNRIKKAAKMIVQGLHDKDFPADNNNKPANTDATMPKKVKALKKAKKQKAPSN